MILRTSGIGVSIAFLREAQWGVKQMIFVISRLKENRK